MAALPWYGLWNDFPTHGKTLALCAALRDDNAGMYMIRLFSHCATQALDGRVPAAIVEGAAGWRKKRGVLLDALKAVGFLEPCQDGTCIVHGWEERNGSRIRKAIADAKKPRGNKAPSRPSPDAVPLGTDAGPERESQGESSGTDGGSPGGDGRLEKRDRDLNRHRPVTVSEHEAARSAVEDEEARRRFPLGFELRQSVYDLAGAQPGQWIPGGDEAQWGKLEAALRRLGGTESDAMHSAIQISLRALLHSTEEVSSVAYFATVLAKQGFVRPAVVAGGVA